jgi:hypothetical protein
MEYSTAVLALFGAVSDPGYDSHLDLWVVVDAITFCRISAQDRTPIYSRALTGQSRGDGFALRQN